jgi:metal-responsive CopG/Arc/MetJ family transcriptional regulator
MRTTIELPDEVRAALLELAARRGKKGFSALVQEAVTRYLEAERQRVDVLEKAKAVLGQLGEAEAAELAASVTALRARWR